MSKFRFFWSAPVKSITCAALLAFSLGFIAPRSTAAQSADGSVKFSLDDDLSKNLDFVAVTNRDGSASGRMSFSGPAEFPDQDVDGTGKGGFSGRIENLQIDAEFDGLVVDRNRAVMSGTVVGSTLGDYVGQRVLLVVEDNGAGIEDKAADKLTWGVYKPAETGWIPSDAEVKDDRGWSMTWLATDAERRDDKGFQITREWSLTTHTFPVSSYDFVDPASGAGNITVKP
ncbi:MAG TPA: hypothetical protein VF544_18760 [Pyrinomonadaceae bacterium]|jgi:hypothetical protein